MTRLFEHRSMPLRLPHSVVAGLLAVVIAACGASEVVVEQDLGPLGAILDRAARRVWPGHEQPDGNRVISLNNGFAGGERVSYWYGGLTTQDTAEVYWFCRDGDVHCPLDDGGAVDFSRVVGGPIFTRIPGESSYSPYWWIKVVRVPESYEPNDLKSVLGVEAAVRSGAARLEWYHFSYGGSLGPTKAIQNSILVLAGTELERNGADLPGQPGVHSVEVPVRQGWHKQYRVSYYDFTHTEGVFPPVASGQEEWVAPSIPGQPIYMLSRDCPPGTESVVCSGPGGLRGVVSERAVGVDLTSDGDSRDTNHIVEVEGDPTVTSSVAGVSTPLVFAYEVRVLASDASWVDLIDSTGEEELSDVRSSDRLFELAEQRSLAQPVVIEADRFDEYGPGALGEQALLNFPRQRAR